MQSLTTEKLTGARETLLIPLWARAVETAQPAPILVDPKAVAMVDAIDYDFRKFERMGGKQAGYCIRATIIDRWVEQFLLTFPAGTVVEIGAGLDTRFERVDNGSVRWYDLDLPEVIEMREAFLEQTPRRTFLKSSALDPQWIETVQADVRQGVMFIAEGVFYFLTKAEIISLFSTLAEHFPGSTVAFDSQSRFFLTYSKLTHPIQGAKLLSSLTDPWEVETWDPRFQVEESVGFGDPPYYDKHFSRLPPLYRFVRRVFPRAREMFRLNRVRLGSQVGPSDVGQADKCPTGNA